MHRSFQVTKCRRIRDGLFSHVFNDHGPGHEVKIDCLSEGAEKWENDY
jgi:hypothetical protein